MLNFTIFYVYMLVIIKQSTKFLINLNNYIFFFLNQIFKLFLLILKTKQTRLHLI
jgi:hypothetical protein